MNYISPIKIIDTMLGAGTSIPEPAPGELAWVSGGTYVANDSRIRVSTHRRYLCIQAHSGRSQLPENDPLYWEDTAPTLRWAPFDTKVSTQAAALTSLTYVLTPGYFNSLALYGLLGAQVSIVLKDAPGGAVIYSETVSLQEGATGWYEYYFVNPGLITKIDRIDLPIRPNAELTLTVSAAAGSPVAVGMITCGDNVSLLGDMPEIGGVEWGASAEPTTSSYITTNQFGDTKIVRRHASTNLSVEIVVPRAQLDKSMALIQSVLDVPVAWIAKPGENNYKGLSVFGLGNAKIAYENDVYGRIDLTVRGFF